MTWLANHPLFYRQRERTISSDIIAYPFCSVATVKNRASKSIMLKKPQSNFHTYTTPAFLLVSLQNKIKCRQIKSSEVSEFCILLHYAHGRKIRKYGRVFYKVYDIFWPKFTTLLNLWHSLLGVLINCIFNSKVCPIGGNGPRRRYKWIKSISWDFNSFSTESMLFSPLSYPSTWHEGRHHE